MLCLKVREFLMVDDFWSQPVPVGIWLEGRWVWVWVWVYSLSPHPSTPTDLSRFVIVGKGKRLRDLESNLFVACEMILAFARLNASQARIFPHWIPRPIAFWPSCYFFSNLARTRFRVNSPFHFHRSGSFRVSLARCFHPSCSYVCLKSFALALVKHRTVHNWISLRHISSLTIAMRSLSTISRHRRWSKSHWWENNRTRIRLGSWWMPVIRKS